MVHRVFSGNERKISETGAFHVFYRKSGRKISEMGAISNFTAETGALLLILINRKPYLLMAQAIKTNCIVMHKNQIKLSEVIYSAPWQVKTLCVENEVSL